MSVSIYSISKRFRKLFLDHIKKQLAESRVTPIQRTAQPGLLVMNRANDDDLWIFYAVLDYPIQFFYCAPEDFRSTYLNHRTDIEVEVFGSGSDDNIDADKPWNPLKTFIPFNKCFPFIRTTLNVWQENSDSFKRVIGNLIDQYLDYLIACVLKQPVIPEEFKTVVEEHYSLFPNYVIKPFPKKIPKIYSEHFLDYYINDTIAPPYFVTTWDEKEGFQDKWMFFGDLLKEAEKIKNGPHPCSDYLQQYPELNKMLDIDELWIYDLWHHCITRHMIRFLEKDWFTTQNNNDYNLLEFQGDNYRIKTTEELIAQELESEPPENLVNDGFDGETMTTYADRQEMHINYLKHISNIPKTVWGYKKEPCPIIDIWFKMHGNTD